MRTPVILRRSTTSAKCFYDRLVAEHGFTGGETTVRRLVRRLRKKPQEAFVPLIFPARDAMQIDWGEATVYLSGVKTVVNLFCTRLCYSGVPIVLAYHRQEGRFLDALVQVFRYFGGVPRLVILDNGKVAVKDGFGAHARKQAGYAVLATLYGFEAVCCKIRPPATKRVLWKAWWAIVAAIPVSRFKGGHHGGSEPDAP